MSRKFTNAYMLVYVRETEINEVLCPVTIDDVPQAFLERMEREREEQVRCCCLARRRLGRARRRHHPDAVTTPHSAQQLRILRDREEEHLLMDVRVVLQEHFRANTGLDLYVRKPLDVPASGYLWRLHKAMTLHGACYLATASSGGTTSRGAHHARARGRRPRPWSLRPPQSCAATSSRPSRSPSWPSATGRSCSARTSPCDQTFRSSATRTWCDSTPAPLLPAFPASSSNRTVVHVERLQGLDDIRLQLKSKGPLCLFLELPTVPLQELATVSPDKYFEPITADRHLIFIKCPFFLSGLPPFDVQSNACAHTGPQTTSRAPGRFRTRTRTSAPSTCAAASGPWTLWTASSSSLACRPRRRSRYAAGRAPPHGGGHAPNDPVAGAEGRLRGDRARSGKRSVRSRWTRFARRRRSPRPRSAPATFSSSKRYGVHGREQEAGKRRRGEGRRKGERGGDWKRDVRE